MKVLISEKLSEHKYKTPEGYLICTDAILARTGKQTYTKDELFGDSDETEVDVDRPYNEVMNPKTIASFENKPVTFDHPNEDVNVGNYKDYAIGYVRDVHQGKTDKGEDVILGNLVITDQDAINAIEQGDHTDLSCGYDCDIKDDNKGAYMQTNIRGNHVALCEQGRAGIARIVDSRQTDEYDDKTHTFSRFRDSYVIEELPEDETADIYIPILKKYNLKIQKLSGNKVKVIGNRNDIVRYYDKEIGIDEDEIGIEDSKMNDKLSYEAASSDDNYLDEVEKMIYKFANVSVDAMLVGDKLKIAARNSKGFTEAQLQDIVKTLSKYVDVSDITASNPNKFDSQVTARIVDSKIEDAEYTYKLTKKKNDYGEYVIRAYKNGKKNEDATYYTDDWDDAIITLKSIAKQQKLTFRQQGSVFVADNKAKVLNDSKEMTMSDALRMLNIVKSVKARDEYLGMVYIDGRPMYVIHKKEPGIPEFWGITPSKWSDNPKKKFKSKKELDEYLTSVNAVSN